MSALELIYENALVLSLFLSKLQAFFILVPDVKFFLLFLDIKGNMCLF